MDAVFQLKEKAVPAPAAGTKVLKAAQVAELHESGELLAAAREEAERIRAKAEEDYRVRYDEGYNDGLEAGKMENAEKMMETVMASVEFIETIENTVVDVVNQSIRKIVGEMDDKDRIVRIVHTALHNVRGQQKVTVRVAPADEPVLTEALAAMTQASYLTVVADARLEKGSCILESSLGVVDASLSTQLAALEHAFTSKIRH